MKIRRARFWERAFWPLWDRFLVAVHFTDDERVYRDKSGIRGVGNKRCGKEMPLFLFVLNETPQLSSRISLRQHGNFHNLFIN